MTIEPYNYNDEPSGRTDTLIQALDKIERLEKQLNIAKHALIEYAYGQIQEVQEIDGEDVPLTYPYSNDEGEVAKNALKQIKKLEK